MRMSKMGVTFTGGRCKISDPDSDPEQEKPGWKQWNLLKDFLCFCLDFMLISSVFPYIFSTFYGL